MSKPSPAVMPKSITPLQKPKPKANSVEALSAVDAKTLLWLLAIQAKQ
jgi:hypothetical protein